MSSLLGQEQQCETPAVPLFRSSAGAPDRVIPELLWRQNSSVLLCQEEKCLSVSRTGDQNNVQIRPESQSCSNHGDNGQVRAVNLPGELAALG